MRHFRSGNIQGKEGSWLIWLIPRWEGVPLLFTFFAVLDLQSSQSSFRIISVFFNARALQIPKPKLTAEACTPPKVPTNVCKFCVTCLGLKPNFQPLFNSCVRSMARTPDTKAIARLSFTTLGIFECCSLVARDFEDWRNGVTCVSPSEPFTKR